jgi:hypothetical protein
MNATTHSSLAEALERAAEARRRGAEFLLGSIGPNGSVERTDARITWYRVPWALAVCGETAAAHRVLNWVDQECLAEDGSFHGGIELDPALNHTTNTYAETCLAYGAVLLRRLDIAQRCMTAARAGFDEVTGGVFMDRRFRGPSDGQLLFLTSQYGMSAAITGHVEDARRVGQWLENLWNAQPGLPDKLYTVWTRDGGLATAVPEGEDARHFVQLSGEQAQLHYNGGIAAAALVHIGMVTGETRWYDLARRSQQFSIDSTPLQFNTRQVCKSAWGSGLITLATGTDVYRDWLIKMVNWFADLQEENGSWRNTPALDPEPSASRRVEVTAEFVVHLDTALGALETLQ